MKWIPGNRIKIISEAKDFFGTLESFINNAKQEIYFETYIFEIDQVGSKILTALVAAARRGVRTHLLIDGVGSNDFDETMAMNLKKEGIQIHIFKPIHRWFKLGRSIFRRVHRKIVVIDQNIAFVGGMNIYELQLLELDFVCQIEGPLVSDIRRLVALFFYRSENQWISFFNLAQKRLRRSAKLLHGISAAFVIRDNIRHRRKIERAYVNAIRKSKKEVMIANAYFIPGYRIRNVLVEAARSGVRVVLLLQGQSDLKIVQWAARALYRDLLAEGIEIYEYHRQILHAKVAVIDEEWFTVGSANLDLFSLFLGLEANIVAKDKKIAHQVRSELNREIELGATAISMQDANMRSIQNRLLSYVALIFFKILRFLTGASTYSLPGENQD